MNDVGLPFHSPMRKRADAVSQDEVMCWPVAVVSAVILTVRAAMASSSWERGWVQVPGFRIGLLKVSVDASGVHQYCA
ncbi:hypothetical protein, partial [Streptomyces broussonetiae]|uniref:hypothetical protein n=1 Tax=Streptomyces broussonetiae TaxID=2686304 RepID=UPI0035DDC169